MIQRAPFKLTFKQQLKMFQRLFNAKKWMWCYLILSFGPGWNLVSSVTVPSPPNVPSTIEAQAKFFQYRHLPTSEDFDQGHRQGSERHFVERHERSRPATGLFSAKVRWGDKKGGYGEHYWDLNHAGHTDNYNNNDYDDGSYREDPHDINNESNERLHNYEIDEYNPDDTTHYEENGRAKRAHTKIRNLPRQDNRGTEREQSKQIRNEQNKEEQEERRSYNQEKHERRRNQEEHKLKDNNEEVPNRPLNITPKRRIRERNNDEIAQKSEKNHIVLVVKQRQKDLQEDDTQSPEPKAFVPYEGGAGMMQHVQPEAAPTTVPRLFLDPTTGHIVDRTTGQAYVLQPIPHNVRYN